MHHFLRLGWTFRGPFNIIVESGKDIDLLHTPSSIVRKLATQAFFRQSVSRHLGNLTDGHEFSDLDIVYNQGLLLLPIQRLLCSRSTPPLEASRLLSIVCGHFWSKSLLQKMGYVFENLNCPLCGLETDSLRHRLYCCHATSHLWSKLPAGMLRMARNNDDLLYTRALLPQPGTFHETTAPMRVVFIGQGSDNSDTFGFNCSDGPIYTDGSAFNAGLPCAVAGASAVQVGEDGAVLKAAYVSLPQNLPQDSTIAEHAAFFVASDLAVQEAESQHEARVDCTSVLVALSHGAGYACDAQRRASIVWRSLFNLFGADLPITSATHVKAHRDLAEVATHEILDYWGNFHADRLAKEGAKLHDLDEHAVSDYIFAYRKAQCIAKQIAAAGALFPTFRQLVKMSTAKRPRARKDSGNRGGHIARDYGHEMFWDDRTYRCSVCGISSRKQTGPHIVCPGESRLLTQLVRRDLGHSLMLTVHSGRSLLVYCRVCGLSAETKAVGLLRGCDGAPTCENSHGAKSLNRIRNGKHPTKKDTTISKPMRLVVRRALPSRHVPEQPINSMTPSSAGWCVYDATRSAGNIEVLQLSSSDGE